MSELVRQLSQGKHRIALDRYGSAVELRSRIEGGIVLVKFIDTAGGTELGVRVERNSVIYRTANVDLGADTVQFDGHVTLDFMRVQCHSEVDLGSMSGEGYLVLVSDQLGSVEC